MGHHYITEVKQENFVFTGKAKLFAIVLLIAGLVLATVGAMNVKSNWGNHDNHEVSQESNATAAAHTGEAQAVKHSEATYDAAPESAHGGEHQEKSWLTRLWATLLLNSYYFLLISVAALFFLAVNYVANAGWAVLVKRVMEAVSAYIPFGLVTLVLVLVLSDHHIYHWIEYFSHGFKEGDAGYDRILESKHWLLNTNALYIMIPAILLIWTFFRFKFRRNSINEDKADSEGALALFRNSTRWGAAFLFFFAFSFSVVSWMVMMSIDAHWYSTMFSIYNFAIAFVSGLSVMTVLVLYLKSKGYMEVVSDEVIHDMAKFMFAFCIFWGYIFLGQWLLIWYANIPEETVYFLARLKGGYGTLFYVNIFMNFLIPFLVLMMRNAKRTPIVIYIAALFILVGHWLDLYLMIMPGTVGDLAGFGLLEIGSTMAFAGLFIFIVFSALSKAGLYTINHPYILESANHDVGV